MVQMRRYRNFHQGGRVQVSLTKKLWQRFLLVLSLFYRSQMVNFKEIYRFSRLQMGSNFFQGVHFFHGMSTCLFSIETHLICDFPEGVRTPCPPLWIRTWCSPHSFMVKATIHYLIWAWQTLIDRRMYHPFIVIYLIISVYYRNLRCFNRWQLYILFNNVSYFGWSLTNHWPRALFPIKHDCRGLNCHFNLLTDILCELRYRRLCFIEKWPKCSIIIRYATSLHRIGDNWEGSEQSMNVDRKSLKFSICRQSSKQTAIQKVCFWRYLIYVRQ